MRTGCELMDLPIHAAITSIDILEERRREKRMVERRIEDLLLLLRPSFYANPRQFPSPQIGSLGADVLEVPSGYLRIEIAQSSVRADPGDSRLHKNRFPRSGGAIDHALQRPSFDLFRRIGDHAAIGKDLDLLDIS